MKNLIMFIILAGVFYWVIFLIPQNPQTTDNTAQQNNKQVVSTQNISLDSAISKQDLEAGLTKFLSRSDFKVVYNMSDKTADYVKNRSYLKNAFEQDKKVVDHPPITLGAKCPGGRSFSKAMENVLNNRENSKYYHFQATPHTYRVEFGDASSSSDFSRKCSTFCIINPETNHLVSFPGVGEQHAKALQPVLDYLKDKNF